MTIIAISYMLLINRINYNGYVVYNEDKAVAYVEDKSSINNVYNNLKKNTNFKEFQLKESFKLKKKDKIDIEKFFYRGTTKEYAFKLYNC